LFMELLAIAPQAAIARPDCRPSTRSLLRLASP
jgi:hypothetical protein